MYSTLTNCFYFYDMEMNDEVRVKRDPLMGLHVLLSLLPYPYHDAASNQMLSVINTRTILRSYTLS